MVCIIKVEESKKKIDINLNKYIKSGIMNKMTEKSVIQTKDRRSYYGRRRNIKADERRGDD